MGVIVRAQDVSKTFGKQELLEDISFEVNGGSICGFIGASGSGKTTLLHLLAGFMPLDEGKILLKTGPDFCDVAKDPDKVKRVIGFSPQTPSFYEQLTILENLLYFAALYQVPPAKAMRKASELLRLVGLLQYQNQFVSTISGGMRKRLDIACALVHDPDILLLDEPTADLDPLLRKHMWNLLDDIKKQGKTIILTSHFLDEIDEYCDFIGVIHKKRLVHFCSPQELHDFYTINKTILLTLDPPKYTQVIAFLSKNKKLKLSAIHIEENCLEISAKDLSPVLLMLSSYCKKNNLSIVDIESSYNTLNSIFETLVTQDAPHKTH